MYQSINLDGYPIFDDVLLQDPTSGEIAGNPSLTCVRDFSFGEGQSKKIYYADKVVVA